MTTHCIQASIGPATDFPSHLGLPELFRQNLEPYLNKTAVRHGMRTISFGELDLQADQWASWFVRLGVRHEEPVGLMLEPGIDQVMLQLAIVRAGGTCVPLDPAQPDTRLTGMLAELDCRILVTRARWQSRLPVESVLTTEQVPPQVERIVLPAGHGLQRTHVLHTSGSTGKPKAVEIVGRGVSRLVLNQMFAPLHAEDVIAAISNPTFDASLFEIWGALLNKATLVIFSKQDVVDPSALREGLRVNRITSLCITTALFNLTAMAFPDAFKGLRNVLVGGEAANAHAMRQVLLHSAPGNLRNAYGPTENTTYSLSYKITHDLEGHGSVSIGSAIDNTQAYILDENFRPVQGDAVGELFLGGDGLARGYWNQADLTAERFRMLTIEAGKEPVRLYRTGDLARFRQDGLVEFLGRRDQQIKLHGYRIELEEIEAVLLDSGTLKGAVVDVIRPESELAEPYLLAYVVPAEPDQFDAARTAAYLAERLPAYMLPRIEQVDSIPLNPNGKADRVALKTRRARLLQDEQPVWQGADALQAQLVHIWKTALDLVQVDPYGHFFELGGTSLKAARLVLEVGREFDLVLPVQALYEHATLDGLTRYLRDRLERGAGLELVDDITPMQRDALLADGLVPLGGPVIDWMAAEEGRVFVTGATGFLGAFFLADLLAQDHVTQIACLVRADSVQVGLARIQANMAEYGLWSEKHAQRLQVYPGNLADPFLGLGQTVFAELAHRSSVVFHLGAHVDYTQPYAAHRPANVLGTVHVLNFANTGRRKPLHYVSSIAAYGPTGFFTGIKELREDEPLEPHLHALKYDMGYSQSQWVAERLVWSAQAKGMPIAVYRPGFIMGDSRRGHGNTKDFVARLIKGCVMLGAYPILPAQSKEFVSVDFVSHALLNISKASGNLGKAYNLVPQQDDETVDLGGLFDLVNHSGYSLQPLPYGDWVARLEQDRSLEANPLLPLVPMLKEPVYGELTRWELYEGTPAYRSDNVRAALGPGVCSGTLDRTLLRHYLNSWEQRGFLEPRRPRHTDPV